MHALAAREREHALDDVLLGVQDDVVCAVRARDGGLLRGRRRPDDGRPSVLRELREDEAEAARDGVDEHGVARAQPVRLLDEGDGGEALERRGRGGQQRHVLGQGEDLRPGDRDELGVHAKVDLGGGVNRCECGVRGSAGQGKEEG